MEPKQSARDRIRQRGLMAWPDFSYEYSTLKAGDTKPRVIQHPFYDLKVQIDPLLGGMLSMLLEVGDYELTDLELFERYLKPGDRVLDVGGGIGLTAAFCSQLTGETVTVIEPDLRLHPLIRRNALLNEVSVDLQAGCVVPQATGETISFHVHEEFWRSTAVPCSDTTYSKTIEVPTLALNTLLQSSRPDVLILDIEGAEVGLFNEPLAFFPQQIFIEIHTPNIGEEASAKVIQQIISQGYQLQDFRSWTFAFKRSA